MIFEELIAETCERLNLTSETAKSRVARELNNRYKRLTSSIGLITSRYATVTGTAEIGNRTMTVNGVEKVNTVVDPTDPDFDVTLTHITTDEMHITPLRSEPPRNYAITRVGSNTVDLLLDCVPVTAFTLSINGVENVSTLSGSDTPSFPESFHDILVWGAMADEYRKMEKLQLMGDAELNYERRLSDLRMFIAKDAYLDIYQGRKVRRSPWFNNNTSLWTT